MTHQVSLSDRAYARLRRSRLKSESFSDTVERLLDERSKDPLRFVERIAQLPRVGSYEERVARIEKERTASREPA